MSREAAFIARMRALATDAGARALADDAAILSRPAGDLVLTHDMLVEGVHFLPDDPPESVAWKLVAVNLSDLAAKGAKPVGVLIGYGLTGDSEWDAAFATGLGTVLTRFDVPLLGGDTVSLPSGGPRTLGLTALGAAPACGAPDRRGAQEGDLIFVTGAIGDAGAGLALLTGRESGPDDVRDALTTAYRTPMPQLPAGQAIAPFVSAMADVSDGLLIDAGRIAQASGLCMEISLEAVPLSPAYIALRGDTRDSRLAAATAGDDYQLILTAPPQQGAALHGALASLPARKDADLRLLGRCVAGQAGLNLFHNGEPCPLPAKLGYEHEGTPAKPA